MKTKTEIYTLPTYWASYLINADASGYSDEELAEINNFIEGKGSCIHVSEESYFKWSNDANNLGCDVSEFTFFSFSK
jgi:hypothetical protein